MKLNVQARGLLCEGRATDHTLLRLVHVKGTLTLRQYKATSPPWEKFNATVYSTLHGHLGGGPSGADERPITLVAGDFLVFKASYELDLRGPIFEGDPDEYIELSGNVLGGYKSLAITRAELVNLTRPKTIPLQFTDGSKSVRVDFVVKKETA
jgi:hypothetical protein